MAQDFVSTATGSKSGTIQAALEELFVHVFITRYLMLLGFVLLLYDHILTIPEEISVIWKRNKSLVGWIFLVNRYTVPFIIAIDVYDKTGLSGGLSDTFCRSWMLIEAHLHILSHASIHALVALRVSAIWGHHTLVKWTVAVSWAIYFIATFTLGSYGATKSNHTFIFDMTTKLCFGTLVSYLWVIWLPPMIFECLMFGLTITRAVQQYRTSVKMMPFAQILYRDGAIYFMIICFCSIFNLLTWKFGSVTLSGIAKYFTFSIVNVTASRMVLNLRAQGGVSTYLSEDDREFSYIIDAQSYEQTIEDEAPKDIEEQHLAQVKQLRSLKVDRPAVKTMKSISISNNLSRRPTTAGSMKSPASDRFMKSKRPATSEGAISVTRSDAETWEMMLPRNTAHLHLRSPTGPTRSYEEQSSFQKTIELEVLSSDSSHGAGGHKLDPRHETRHGGSDL